MTLRLDQLNVNVVNLGAPSLCEICGSIHHLTINYQVGCPFAQDTSNYINYVNYNLRPINDPYSNASHLGWRSHPKFSYRSNLLNMPK